MPAFFETPEGFGDWLAEHGADETELVVGFHKRGSGKPSMTWPEAVDEALCHGWIDGVRTNIDAQSYRIRFTPRKGTSTWSARNIERMRVLDGEGRVHAAGRAAFAQRREAKSGTYSYEQKETARFDPIDESLFRNDAAAWAFFEARPAGYRHLNTWRIVSAKRPETRASRLAKLIAASREKRRI